MLAVLMAACQNNAGGEQQASNETNEMEETAAPELKYTLTPFTASTAYPDAKIASVSYAAGQFDFGIEGETYELGVQTPDAGAKMCANSAKGQHIHLIIDDQPYAAKYESSFAYEIPDGEHYMLAFLSRSYHESIKTDAAHVAKAVTVKDNGFEATSDIEAPMLFYSRPKGTYTGAAETEKVMLDFYLANVPGFGTEHFVMAEINGEVHKIDTWQPYYIEGMPMGENTIKLTLVDKAGNAIDTPLNPVSRTFTLQEEQPAG